MKYILLTLSFFIFFSCIPLRIAPKIEGDKLMIAKKFKRKLPRQNALVFEDPKDANEFIDYITMKYKSLDNSFVIDNEEFTLTFYEVEKTSKTLNLVPLIVNAGLESKGHSSLFDNDIHISRTGTWYLVLTIFDATMNDGLNPKHKSYKEVVKYVKAIKEEYLNTQNYLEVLMKK